VRLRTDCNLWLLLLLLLLLLLQSDELQHEVLALAKGLRCSSAVPSLAHLTSAVIDRQCSMIS
jgi:hypothetical protein